MYETFNHLNGNITNNLAATFNTMNNSFIKLNNNDQQIIVSFFNSFQGKFNLQQEQLRNWNGYVNDIQIIWNKDFVDKLSNLINSQNNNNNILFTKLIQYINETQNELINIIGNTQKEHEERFKENFGKFNDTKNSYHLIMLGKFEENKQDLDQMLIEYRIQLVLWQINIFNKIDQIEENARFKFIEKTEDILEKMKEYIQSIGNNL
jgi:hypothetical protein